MGNCRRSFNLRSCAHLFLVSVALVATETPSEQAAGDSVVLVDDANENFDLDKLSVDSNDVRIVSYEMLEALRKKHLEKKTTFEYWKTAAELLVLGLLALVCYMLSRLSPEEAAKFFPQPLIDLYLKHVAPPVPFGLQHLERSGSEAARVVACEALGFEKSSNVVTKVVHNGDGGAMYMCSSENGREAAKDAMDAMDQLPSGQVPNDAAIEAAFENTCEAGKSDGGQVRTSTAAAFFEKTEDGKYAVKVANAGDCMAVIIKRIPGSPYKVNPEEVSQIEIEKVQHEGETVYDSYKPVITTPGEELIVEEGSLIMIADQNFWDATAKKGVEQTTNDLWGFASVNEEDFCASSLCEWIIHRQKSSGSVMIARLADGSNWNDYPDQILGFNEMANPSCLRTAQAEYKNSCTEFLELFGFDGPPPRKGEWYSFSPAGEPLVEVNPLAPEIELVEQTEADIDDIEAQTDAAVKF